MQHRATVIGAGVVGLTTALLLHDDGWTVDVVATEPPAATTSAVAAALWYPYLVGPADAVTRWGQASARRFAALARHAAVPVRARRVHELLREPEGPGWRQEMPDLAPVDELPDWASSGWSYTSWVADMPRYLDWLLAQLAGRTVVPRTATVTSLAEAATDTDLVVDCAGLGARELAGDVALTPVAGQVVLVRAPAVQDVWLAPDHDGGATYLIPREDLLVCGGTADEGHEDRTPDPDVTAAILRRCVQLHPAVADAEVVDVRVGLRPSRPAVRVELEPAGTSAPVPVLHNYGHGGAGVTLSWGSAAEAVRLAHGAWG